jgi:hypothetical protein
MQHGKHAPTTGPAPINVFVKLHGTGYAGVDIAGDAFVADLQDAIVAKFKLDAAPHQLVLKLEDAAEPLDARKRLAASAITAGASLIVEVHPAAGACVGSLAKDGQQ